MVQNKKFIKNLLIALGTLLMVGFLVYSLIKYQQSGIAEDGVVTCANGKCFWSAHLHVNIPIQICGEEYILSKFKGPLSDAHSHGDENVIHWHDKVPFDAEKKQFLESSPFALNLIFKTLELPITDESLLGKKDGDLCRGSASTWKVFVNGVLHPESTVVSTPVDDWRNYEWRDRDTILFVFDARTVEEVETELRQNPIKFPSVGEG